MCVPAVCAGRTSGPMAMARYLKRRVGIGRSGDRWYVRVRVPADLRGRFGKLEAIEKALGTGDPREAQRRRHAAVAAILERFEQARRAPSPAAAISEARRAELRQAWRVWSGYIAEHGLSAAREALSNGIYAESMPDDDGTLTLIPGEHWLRPRGRRWSTTGRGIARGAHRRGRDGDRGAGAAAGGAGGFPGGARGRRALPGRARALSDRADGGAAAGHLPPVRGLHRQCSARGRDPPRCRRLPGHPGEARSALRPPAGRGRAVARPALEALPGERAGAHAAHPEPPPVGAERPLALGSPAGSSGRGPIEPLQ